LNTTNFIKDVGIGNAEIEIVANGAGVSGYVNQSDQDLMAKMTNLAKDGVKFAACRNALNMHKLDENKLPSFVSVVPAGITEIVNKQAAGFAYIKP
jgi:intracellular sulfur oxidation DsrE/DsrF family protein